MRRLRKDNTGYDLKQLFVGGEGTLGIITGAVLKLFPKPKDVQTCFAAIRDREAMIELLTLCRAASGDSVTSFEYIPADHHRYRHAPSPRYHRSDGTGLRALRLDRILRRQPGQRYAGGHGKHAGIGFRGRYRAGRRDLAIGGAPQRFFWFIRDGIVEASKEEGPRISHDVSVPVSDVPRFLKETDAKLGAELPGCRPGGFGHIGDGNIHYGVYAPVGMSADDFAKVSKKLDHILLESVAAFDGSFSAEHGIGQQKKAYMPMYRSEIELDMMRKLKATIDPDNLMNPGKVL